MHALFQQNERNLWKKFKSNIIFLPVWQIVTRIRMKEKNF